MKIHWELSIGLVGCRRGGTLDVDDDADEKEIEEIVREEVFQHVDWNWEREQGDKS